MHKALPLFLIAAFCLTGCDKSKTSGATTNAPAGSAVSSDDPVQKKLQELAGGNAKNCGVLKTQGTPELDAASKCAVDSSKANAPFFVEYQMPGMNVAVVGNAQGKLYSVQSQEGGAGIVSGDCPSALRVAPSGRVTCYAPGTFPMSAGAGSHTNMAPTIPPMMGTGGSPHGAMPAGHPAVKPKPPTP
jgi:hypothetical protein